VGGFPELALSSSDLMAQQIMREDVVDNVLKRDLPALYCIRNATNWRIADNGVRFFLLTGTKKALLIDSGMNTPTNSKSLLSTGAGPMKDWTVYRVAGNKLSELANLMEMV